LAGRFAWFAGFAAARLSAKREATYFRTDERSELNVFTRVC
jgi:hypothetical protein